MSKVFTNQKLNTNLYANLEGDKFTVECWKWAFIIA